MVKTTLILEFRIPAFICQKNDMLKIRVLKDEIGNFPLCLVEECMN